MAATRHTRSTASSSLFDELFWFDAQGRPTKVWRSTAANGQSPDTTRFVYSGLGAVQSRERIDQFGNWETEEYRVDALGNNVESRDGGTNNHGVQDPRYWQYSFHGELAARNTYQPQQAEEFFKQGFDGDGNVAYRFLLIHRFSGSYEADDQARNYYDAANRLRAVQHYTYSAGGDSHGSFDEYEYDALGRRIVVVSRRHESMPACNNNNGAVCNTLICTTVSCNSSLTRYMWDGSQTLVEDRQAFATSSAGPDDGYVTYVHGTEIDRPLGVIDSRVTGGFRVPHPTWRAMYESSSTASGSGADCSLTNQSCTLVGWNATSSLYKLDAPSDVNPGITYTWVGGLLMDQQDATGLLYRRNRYYDPMSGRFSQEDPIGMAGGLNTYGFAAGDPVNYSDPFGFDCRVIATGEPCRPKSAWGIFGPILKAAGQAVVENFLNNVLPSLAGGNSCPPPAVCGMVPPIFGGPDPFPELGPSSEPLVRTAPANLTEQLTLEEAKAGAGTEIMQGKIKDGRRTDWAKMSHVHKNPDGTLIEVHTGRTGTQEPLRDISSRNREESNENMKTRCISNRGDDLPAGYLDPPAGYRSDTGYPVTVGKEYVVYALTVRRGRIWFYILDDRGLNYPIWFPGALFEISDGRLSRQWIFGFHESGERDGDAIFAFRAWADDPYEYYDKLSDGDPKARATFAKHRAFMDLEFVDEAIEGAAESLGDGWLMCPRCREAWQTSAVGEMVTCPNCRTRLKNPMLLTD